MTYPERLLSSFRELSGLVLARETVRSTLDVVAHLAVETIPVCDVASISLVGVSGIATVGTSDDVAFLLDAIQYETGEGPCLDAIGKDAAWFRLDQMSSDSTWPNFSKKAAAQGFESLLAFTLRIDSNTLGALNLYAREPYAYGEGDVDNGAIYAAHAAVALERAQARSRSTGAGDALNEAAVSQEIIARAVGILMDKDFRSADESLELLQQRAEALKIKLHESATEVVILADTERAALSLPEGFADRIMGRSKPEWSSPSSTGG